MDMELVAREPLIKTATRSEGTALEGEVPE